MKRTCKWVPWVLGAILTALFLLAFAYGFGIRFENSDDALLLKGFMGFEGGKPISFSFHMHTFLTWFLHGLGLMAPAMPWFALLQIGLLWISGTVVIARGFEQERVRGGLISLAYLLAFCVFGFVRISYVTTAAMCGAAAVWMLTSLQEEGDLRKRRFDMALAILLLLLAYSLRMEVALPVLPYCLLALAYHAVRAWKEYGLVNTKPFAVCGAILCVLLLLFVGVRTVEIHARHLQDDVEWHRLRIELMDYTSFERNLSPAIAADSRLSDNELVLMQEWYFWDADMDAQAFQKLANAYSSVPHTSALSTLVTFLSSNPRYLWLLALQLILVLRLWLLGSENRLDAICALLAMLGGIVMILYLCWRGRMLYRAADTVFLPCAALLFALTLQKPSSKKHLLLQIVCIAICVPIVASFSQTVRSMKPKQDASAQSVQQQRAAELEAFALQNPDKLLVRTPNLFRDTRLRPNVKDGIPANITIWGDWNCRTPGWYDQMKMFGLDGHTFSLSDWTNDVLVFATIDESPPEVFMLAVSEAIGRQVESVRFGEQGTLRFYQLR